MREAIQLDDLDAACLKIQECLDIPSGDVAGIFWCGREDEWKGMDEDDREEAIKDYVKSEINWMI